jgi:8-oxo-dGTP diphosphatase
VTSDSFREFGKSFPFSVVEIIIRDKNNRFLLTKRAITPYKNKWHFPGGVVERNTSLEKMVKIVAKRELNVNVKIDKFVGVYESILPERHDISHLYIVHIIKGDIKLDYQSTEAKFFDKIPKNIIPLHQKMWQDIRNSL